MVLRGKYRLDRVLGMGGMAVVYKATHRNQAEFAVKMLHPELSLNSDIRVRFLREGYAANSVKHPGVVLVVDDDVAEDGAAFLVMELLHGGACEDLWSACGGRLPLDAACAVGVELLDVLGAAHGKGIVHRDIKPANLFVLRDGTLKVLDFGIARVRDTMSGASAHATGTGMLLGTPAFMAPEQALGKSNEIDAQTDVWAVGATLFTLLSGTTVHDKAETNTHLLIKAASEQPRSLSVVVPGVPAAVVAVVDRALAFDKEQRWPSAAAMRDALLAAARESSIGFAPRPVLAHLVASRSAVRGEVATDAHLGATQGDSGAGYQAPRLAVPTPASAAGPFASSPSGGSPSVQTASAVSHDSPISRVRSPASRAVAGLVALISLSAVLAAGPRALRGRKDATSPQAAADSARPRATSCCRPPSPLRSRRPLRPRLPASAAPAASAAAPGSSQPAAPAPGESSAPAAVARTPTPIDSERPRPARALTGRESHASPAVTRHAVPAAPAAPTAAPRPTPAPAAPVPAPPPRSTGDPLDGRQ